MKRRYFLKYTTLGTTGFALAACSSKSDSTNESKQSQAADFGTPEKTNLTLGYVPLIDAAPLIIAKEKGFFARYGLTVSFKRQANAKDIETELSEWRLDAASVPYGMPMHAQLGANAIPIVSLMVLNLNGSAIALSQKFWKAGVRPSIFYVNFQEFSDAFRDYIRTLEQPPNFAIESVASMDTYLYRYWLAAMGVSPQKEVKLGELTPAQLVFKLQSGNIISYCAGEPWNQTAVEKKAGFIAYTSRDIWRGHPGKVLATMQGWADKHPKTARSLVAAIVEACQFCDRPENQAEIAQILSQSQYLNVNSTAIEASLGSNYDYTQLQENIGVVSIPDFNIFHFKETAYLKKNNHANYPWRSHAVWLLTQMVRWKQISQQEYPKDADKLLDKIYPVGIYEEVAKALKIELPTDKMKKEPATSFIDKREFDPSQPVAYLNQFEMRT